MKTKTMKLASRGKRFGAYCIDSIVPFIVSMIIMVMLIGMLAYISDYYNRYSYGYGYSYGPMGGQIAVFVVLFLMLIGYTIVQLFFFSKSMTIGKALLGMQVISAQDGKPIGFWKMLFREWFVKRASSHVFFLGYIWIIIDHKSRGWHDLILETYVIDVKESAKIQEAGVKNSDNANYNRNAAQEVDIMNATEDSEYKEEIVKPTNDVSDSSDKSLIIESVVAKSDTAFAPELELEPVQETPVEPVPDFVTEPSAESDTESKPKFNM